MTKGKWEAELDAVLMQFGITKEPLQSNAAEELASVLHDYNSLAQQYSEMYSRYECPDKPEQCNGIWLCPACHKRIQFNHSRCHWCGKKIGWGNKKRRRKG